jgi:hypothetical protein
MHVENSLKNTCWEQGIFKELLTANVATHNTNDWLVRFESCVNMMNCIAENEKFLSKLCISEEATF